MIRGEPRYATDWGFAPARHEGFPVDAARRLGMIPVVSVPGVHFDLLQRSLSLACKSSAKSLRQGLRPFLGLALTFARASELASLRA